MRASSRSSAGGTAPRSQAGSRLRAGRWVIMGDADDSYDFAELEPFVEQLREGLRPRRGQPLQGRDPARRDAVAAQVARQPGALVHRPAAVRNAVPGTSTAACAASTARRSSAGHPLVGHGVRDRDDRQGDDAGLRVTEVPTTLSPDAEGREPHLNTWTDGWKSVRLLLLYSPKWLFLYPGLLLLVVGIAGMAWLVPGDGTIGGIGFDVTTLLYFSLAVMVGLQAVYFFIMARWFGITEGLLPDDPFIRQIIEPPRRLEWTLVVGLLLIGAGLGSRSTPSEVEQRRFRAAELRRHTEARDPRRNDDRVRHADCLLGALPRRARAAAACRARRRSGERRGAGESSRSARPAPHLGRVSLRARPRADPFHSRVRDLPLGLSRHATRYDGRRAALPHDRREHRLRPRRRPQERLRQP